MFVKEEHILLEEIKESKKKTIFFYFNTKGINGKILIYRLITQLKVDNRIIKILHPL